MNHFHIKSKTTFKYLSSIGLVALILGGMFFLFSNTNLMQFGQQLVGSTTHTTNKPPTPAPDSQNDASNNVYLPIVMDEDWASFTDEEAGYTIQYPNSWNYEQNEFLDDLTRLSKAIEVKASFVDYDPPIFGMEGSRPDGCHFDILLARNTEQQNNLNVDSLPSTLRTPLIDSIPIHIGKYEGIRRTAAQTSSIGSHITEVMLRTTNNEYQYGMRFWSDNEEISTHCNDIFEAMLQSFTIHE